MTTNERTKRNSSIKFLNIIRKTLNDYIEENTKDKPNEEIRNKNKEIKLTENEMKEFYNKLFRGKFYINHL